MKRLTILLCAAAALFACRNTPTGIAFQTDLEKSDLKGKVHTLLTVQYDTRLENGEPVKDRPTDFGTHTFSTYNTDGNLYETVIHGHEGRIQTYEYSSAGQRTREIIFDTLANPMVFTEYSYDPAGRMTGMVTSDTLGQVSGRVAYTYDKNDRIATVTAHDWNDVVYTTYTNEYNRQGKLSKQTQVIYSSEAFSSEGSREFEYVTEFEYNDKGLISAVTISSEALEPKRKVITNTYRFDESGNWVQCYTTDSHRGTTHLLERTFTYYQ